MLSHIIDCHVHVTASGKWFNTGFDASVLRLEKELAKAKVGKVILLPVFPEDLKLCLKLRQSRPEVFYLAPLVNLNNLTGQNFPWSDVVAVKMHPRMQSVAPNSIEVRNILKQAEENDVPVIFDTYMQSNTVPLEQLHPYAYDALAKEYPNVKFVLAHCGWPNLLEAFAVARSNPNVFLELSYFAKIAAGTSIFDDFCHLIQGIDKKVLFGSDFPETSIPDYLRVFHSKLSSVSQDKLDNIFFNNACELFKIQRD